MAQTHTEPHVAFREKVRPSPAMWVLSAIGAGSTALMVLPVWALGAFVLPVITFALLALWLRSLTVTIIVTDQRLYVGEAHIERIFISRAEALDETATGTARGVGLDARAFLVTRPWVKTAVRVDIDDAADPTPYWLVSTRRPRELAAALNG
ncbi:MULTISPECIES: DUF3093 domain-containing protein [Brevibacterium]|nr:DUF3093 domain-containing protein [Brevibacterium casei]NJE68174.1 DUF3093 domain-containing protein [Brevibacterium sp. LS14]KZE19090.1 hypothetical protein AVW13_12340 [Brevibacterium casei]MBE4696068.1 DUF3093 domain-containing protein [Brevibacterium casei]MBY3579190.1 DUF3093 domain-containing protein [Brevibacterium casei]MCT1448165.1 DUF3093 domain-containing protein [Brevibacterium casei]